jgi:predicted Zn-dependent protease
MWLIATTQLSHTQIFLPTQTIGQTEVPEIGSGIGLLDQQKEKLIGEKVYREVHRQMPTVQDAWLEDQFLQVFSGILSQTQLGQPIGLVVIKDPQINAFAVPGGLFALNTGLITSAKNLDEIAGSWHTRSPTLHSDITVVHKKHLKDRGYLLLQVFLSVRQSHLKQMVMLVQR